VGLPKSREGFPPPAFFFAKNKFAKNHIYATIISTIKEQ
jgi:hypothetical protein